MAGHQAVMIRTQLSLGGFEGTTPVTQTHRGIVTGIVKPLNKAQLDTNELK